MARVKKLIMITGDNNNKYYDMFENPGGSTFTVKYGRIGVTEQTQTYPMDKWEKKYNEKVNKGYKDQTEMFLVPDTKSSGNGASTSFVDITDSMIKTFIDTLHRYAKKSVSDNYTVSSAAVTQRQVEEAQAVIDYLTTLAKKGAQVRPINDKLIELYHVIPRRMKHVQDHLFNDILTLGKMDEVDRVLNKLAEEQATLDVMRGQVQIGEVEASDTKTGSVTLLDAMGLRIEKTAKTEESKIRTMMGGEDSKFKKSFQVVNVKTQKKFDGSIKVKADKTTKLFWHGSRNENWLSIMEGGLVLRPANAIITGKMFGYGLYFADKFRKSLGYTSLSGSYWAGGNNNTAYLALYDVHLGKYLKVKHHEGWMSSLNFDSLRRKGDYDSLYAEGGADLRNNEFIVYKEEQCTIKYIVEVGN